MLGRKLTVVALCLCLLAAGAAAQGIIIDHNDTNITALTETAINKAKTNLHIGYGHTSHGSQVTTGMSGLVAFANGGGKGLALSADIFAWNNGGTGGALDLEEGAGYGSGWLERDAGYWETWRDETIEYLEDPSHADVNVIMWSWCGQVSSRTEATMLSQYLTPMSELEAAYPDVTFVYMTGHLDGSGLNGNLHQRNEQIRQYCQANGKVLYDFADIETWDPDGNYYGDKTPNDNCDYDTDDNGSRDGNWATAWQNSHTQGTDWYNCGAAHSQSLNANQKAYAVWALFCELAADVPTDGAFEDVAIPDSGHGHGSSARFAGGKANQMRPEVTTAWSAASDPNCVSDVLSLTGLSPTPGDETFVLEIDYDPAAAGSPFLGWWNGSEWVNAVEGNSDGGAGALFVLGAYDGSLTLGHYGVDTATHTVWAVLDHNSDFAAMVPEPATMTALALGGALGLLRRRRL